MIVAELDEVQYDLEIDGHCIRKQLARRVWEARGWATVACTFSERADDGTWKPAKLALLRFRRAHDAWKRHAQLVVDADTARELGAWLTSSL